jgi:hypothetical protein
LLIENSWDVRLSDDNATLTTDLSSLSLSLGINVDSLIYSLQKQIQHEMIETRPVGFHSFDMFDLTSIVLSGMNVVHQRFNRSSDTFTPLFGCFLQFIGQAMNVKTTAFTAKGATSHGPTRLRRRNQTEIAPIGHAHRTRLETRIHSFVQIDKVKDTYELIVTEKKRITIFVDVIRVEIASECF